MRRSTTSLYHHPLHSNCPLLLTAYCLLPGMKLPHYLLKVIPIQVCIDLRGGDRFMAQHFLDRAQVSSPFDEMCCKRMPERVGADLLFESNGLCQIADDCEHHYSAHATAIAIKKDARFMPLLWWLMRRTTPHLFYVYTHKLNGLPADGYEPLFVPLPYDAQQPSVKIQVVQLKRYQLRYAQPRTVQDFQHGTVARAFGRRQVNRL